MEGGVGGVWVGGGSRFRVFRLRRLLFLPSNLGKSLCGTLGKFLFFAYLPPPRTRPLGMSLLGTGCARRPLIVLREFMGGIG